MYVLSILILAKPMQPKSKNKQNICVFHRWTNKSYAVFNSLKKVINIAALAVGMVNASLKKVKTRICFALGAKDKTLEEEDEFEEAIPIEQVFSQFQIPLQTLNLHPFRGYFPLDSNHRKSHFSGIFHPIFNARKTAKKTPFDSAGTNARKNFLKRRFRKIKRRFRKFSWAFITVFQSIIYTGLLFIITKSVINYFFSKFMLRESPFYTLFSLHNFNKSYKYENKIQIPC